MRLMLGVAAVFLLSGGPALAKDEPKSPEQKLVCKRVYGADLGSHFQSSKRVCHTAAEWKEIEDETNRTLSTIRDHGGASGTPSTGGFGGSPQ